MTNIGIVGNAVQEIGCHEMLMWGKALGILLIHHNPQPDRGIAPKLMNIVFMTSIALQSIPPLWFEIGNILVVWG